MNIKLFFACLFSLNSVFAVAQNNEVPKNIDEALTELNNHCNSKQKAFILLTSADRLDDAMLQYPDIWNLVSHWLNNTNETSQLKTYLSERGITNNQIQEQVILAAFKNLLLNNRTNETYVISVYKLIDQRWKHEDEHRFTIDSLRGVYIPADMEDCFKQIDSFWSDSTKRIARKMSERGFAIECHFGFSMWMRNNWHLRGDSRLSKYFHDRGIFDPDDISSTILSNYHRHLRGKKSKFPKYN